MLKITTFIALLIASLYSQAEAHTVEENRANVILRQGQVELQLTLDLEHWLKAIGDQEAWLMGKTDIVLPEKMDDKKMQGFLRQALLRHTEIKINGKPQLLSYVSFPHQLEAHKPLHIRLEAKTGTAVVKTVALSLPKSLGKVHTRFVNPTYRMLQPGKPLVVAMTE